MSNEACIIIGVPLSEVVEVKRCQAPVTRYNERTGVPFQKNTKVLTVKIAGKTVWEDEEEDIYEDHGNVDSFVDQKIQTIIGEFGTVNVFREYGLLGVDFACIEQGDTVSNGHCMLHIDIGSIDSEMNQLNYTLQKAFGEGTVILPARVFLCGEEK